MAKISDAVLEQIKARLSLGEVVSEYVNLTARGGRLWGLCPFHEEKTPSFSVVEDQGFYYCFSCKRGGSMFDFIMEMEKVTFVESVRMLARRANVELAHETEADRRSRDLRETIGELYEKLAQSFHYLLTESSQGAGARAYLKRRNVDPAMWKAFTLGYAPPDPAWLYSFLRKHHYSEELLSQSGLFSSRNPTYPLFVDRLMFPIFNWQGRCLAFGGRDLSNTSKAKYINTPETAIYSKKFNLYGIYEGLETLKAGGEVILCEGNFDVIALHQAGFSGAVAPLGTAFTAEQAKLIGRYNDRMSILFDSDRAGIEAAEKSVVVAQQRGIATTVRVLADIKDPADLVEREGVAALQRALESGGVDGFHYLVQNAINQYDILTSKGKSAIFGAVRPFLDATTSSIERQGYIQELASVLDIDESSIHDDYSKQRSSPPKTVYTEDPPREVVGLNPAAISVDLYAMLTLVNNRELFLRMRQKLAVEFLEDERAEALYEVLEEAARQGGVRADESILQMINDPQLYSDVATSFSMEEFKIEPQKIIEEAVGRIQMRQYERRRATIRRLLELSLHDGTEFEEIEELLREKSELDREIGELKHSLEQ
ncbi:MAG TPA: DNA primase [Sphaerochaeta sp.]|nr:DNA primase [Sphaerochaeta sp.]